jgi:hypothetical protein
MTSSSPSETRRQIGAVSPDYRSQALFDDSDTVVMATNTGGKHRVWLNALEDRVVVPKEQGQT